MSEKEIKTTNKKLLDKFSKDKVNLKEDIVKNDDLSLRKKASKEYTQVR